MIQKFKYVNCFKRGNMAKKEDKILIWYVIIFIMIALIVANFMFLEGDVADVTVKGVKICNKNYDCGELDRICPEDFGATCIVKDPDCR